LIPKPTAPAGKLRPGLDALAARSRLVAQRLVAGPRWKVRVVFLVLAFSLLRAFPNYHFLNEAENQRTWQDAALKVHDPAADMARAFPPASHEAKLTFRLTVPLLAHALHLGRNAMLSLFAVSGLLLLYLTLDLAYRVTQNRIVAMAVCAAVACVWPGMLAFHQLLGGFYDAVALCLILAAMWAPAPLAAAALFVAAWTDERALLTALLLLVYAAARREPTRAIAVAAAGLAYAGTRFAFASAYGIPTSWDGMGAAVFARQFNMAPLGIWTGLGGCWVLVAAAFWVLLARRRYLPALTFALALSAVMVAALVVEDVTRSMSYTLPAVMVALCALAESEPPLMLERLAAAAALLSAVVPTYWTQSGAATWMLPSVFQAVRWVLYPRLG
jgi:hypothetical protein